MKDQKNLLFIKYEDMKVDLGEVMETVAKFVGKTLSESDKSKLLKHLSFEEMKRNPAVNFEPVLEFHRRFNLVKVDGVFMRSGGEEKSKMNEIDEDLQEKFDDWIKGNLLKFS